MLRGTKTICEQNIYIAFKDPTMNPVQEQVHLSVSLSVNPLKWICGKIQQLLTCWKYSHCFDSKLFKALTKAKCLLKNTFPITNVCSVSFCSTSWMFLWKPGPPYLVQTCALPVRGYQSRACFSCCVLASLLKFCSVYLIQLKVSSCFMSSALECSGRDSGPVATQIRGFCNKVPIWFC